VFTELLPGNSCCTVARYLAMGLHVVISIGGKRDWSGSCCPCCMTLTFCSAVTRHLSKVCKLCYVDSNNMSAMRYLQCHLSVITNELTEMVMRYCIEGNNGQMQTLYEETRPTGYYTYHLLEHTKTLNSARRLYLCVPYGSCEVQTVSVCSVWFSQ
jgi:hypothetical protein